MRIFDLHPNTNTLLVEVAGDRPDIMEAAEQIQNAAVDCALLLEAGEALTPEQIKQLFTNVEAISKGKKPPGKIAQAVGKGAGAVGNLMKVVKDAATKLQNTEPVQNFDAKVQQIVTDYKNKLGPDHKAVKLATTVGEYAKENPKKTAFAIAALTGLAGALGTPGAGAAVGAALRGTVGMMKGEKASSVVGKAAMMGAAGAAAGGIADLLGGADAVMQSGLDIHKPFGDTEMADMMKNDLAMGSLQPNNIGANWEKYARMAYEDDVAKMDLSPLQKQHIYQKIGLQMKGSVLKAAGQQNFKGSGAEWGELVQKTLGESEESPDFEMLHELFGMKRRTTSTGVDAATITQAWEQAGSPTDIASIQKILTQAGVNTKTLQSALQTVGVGAGIGQQGGQQGGKPNLAKSLQKLDDKTFSELQQHLKSLKAHYDDVDARDKSDAATQQKAADEEAYKKNSYARIANAPKVATKTPGIRSQ